MNKVSLIIPTFNRPHLLPRAVESARRAGRNVEVIVVDDASSDDTANVCAGLRDIKYVRLDRNQQFYLMEKADLWIDDAVSWIGFELRKVIWWEKSDRRERKWVALDEAKLLGLHPETEKMLELANDNVPAVAAEN